jgi:hypothetical protein
LIRIKEGKEDIAPIAGKHYEVWEWENIRGTETDTDLNEPQQKGAFLGIARVIEVREVVHLNPIRFLCLATAVSGDLPTWTYSIDARDKAKGRKWIHK